MGIPAPGLMAWATSLLEFLGGISLMLGAYVLPRSLPLSVVMVTAMFGVDLSGALYSHLSVGDPASAWIFPVIGLLLLTASYLLHRRVSAA